MKLFPWALQPLPGFSEIYVKYREKTDICELLLEHHVIGYFRHVDDIRTVYREDHTNIYNIFDSFCNLMHTTDRLCGLVVRVPGYRYRGLGFDSRRYQIF